MGEKVEVWVIWHRVLMVDALWPEGPMGVTDSIRDRDTTTSDKVGYPDYIKLPRPAQATGDGSRHGLERNHGWLEWLNDDKDNDTHHQHGRDFVDHPVKPCAAGVAILRERPLAG